MRELEFLPAWYPQLRRRRRLVVLQVYMSLILLAGLGLGMLKFSRNITHDRQRLVQLNEQLQDTHLVLQKLDELEKLDAQLKVQEQVVEKIGLHVEATRMINALEQAMSSDMSLLNLNMEVFEQQKSSGSLQTLAAALSATADQPKPAVDRTLKVKVHGVAPTDVELGNFLDKLRNNQLFDRVNMNYAKERAQNGHIMREFEVLFNVNLNTQG